MMQLLAFGFCLLLAGPAFSDNYYVVTGSFDSETSAQKQLAHVRVMLTTLVSTKSASTESTDKVVNAEITAATVQSENRFRVSIGPISSVANAEQIQSDAIRQGFAEAWVYSVDSPKQKLAITPPQQPEIRLTHERLPDVLQPVVRPRISEQSHVDINRFVYAAPALEAEIASLLLAVTGKSVEIAKLLATKDSINQLYVVNGFVNTSVVIPDQQIRNGELKLDFISGKVADLQISSRLRQQYIKNRLQISHPFNLGDLQDSLKLLEQNPLVSRIDARVTPSASPEKAVLTLDVDTVPRFSLGLNVANDRAPSIGSENAMLTLGANNLSGWGETYQLSSSVTQGLAAQTASISLPLTSGGTSLQIQYALSDASVIEEPFNDIDVESKTESLSFMLHMPIRKTLSGELSLQLTLEVRKNQTTLLGQSFSFSEGAIDGESKVAPIRVALSYMKQNVNDSLAARLSMSQGTSKFDATVSDDLADGKFTSYLGQVQYSKLLAERFHVTGKVLAQYASDPLLSIERYSLGGIRTIRGYRENQVVRDNVFLASLEGHYRIDLPVWIELVGFVDWGRGENHHDSAARGKTELASVGIGVVVKHWQSLSVELYLAHGFDDFEASKYDLQDDGVHIRLGYRHEF